MNGHGNDPQCAVDDDVIRDSGMDAPRFDRLAATVSTIATRRGFVQLLASLPLFSLLTSSIRVGEEVEGKGRKKKDRGKGKGKNKDKDKLKTRPRAETCWRSGACVLRKGANVSRCNLAGYAAPSTLNCTGCNISRANLRGASLQGANLTRANLSGSCLVDADLTGAIVANSTNLYGAVVCRTRMPDGSLSNAGCGLGSECCPVCDATHPCEGGCCAADGSCQPGDTNAACGPSGGMCVPCTGDQVCNAAHVCILPEPTCGTPEGICRVFVSSTTHNGNFGGLGGADAFCQARANAAGLPGSYKAWLSDATGSPSTRFVRAPGPYQLIDGTPIANNWADLISGALDHAINIDENGDPLPEPDALNDVWTATTTRGDRYLIGNFVVDCENWSIADFDHFGALGTSSLADENWSVAGIAITCATRGNRLYCFQQS